MSDYQPVDQLLNDIGIDPRQFKALAKDQIQQRNKDFELVNFLSMFTFKLVMEMISKDHDDFRGKVRAVLTQWKQAQLEDAKQRINILSTLRHDPRFQKAVNDSFDPEQQLRTIEVQLDAAVAKVINFALDKLLTPGLRAKTSEKP